MGAWSRFRESGSCRKRGALRRSSLYDKLRIFLGRLKTVDLPLSPHSPPGLTCMTHRIPSPPPPPPAAPQVLSLKVTSTSATSHVGVNNNVLIILKDVEKKRMFEVAEAVPLAVGGLRLVRSCGETVCAAYHYCSSHASTCEPCDLVCKVDKNNFDQDICETQCQDYIHDMIKHYSTDADFHKATRDLQVTIDNLRMLTAASLSLSVILFIVMALLGGFVWLRKRRLAKKEQDLMDKKMSTVSTIVNNNVANELNHRLPSTASNTAAPSVITEVTHLSRRPAEDSTLEYAYDNEGMVPSPVVRDARSETEF